MSLPKRHDVVEVHARRRGWMMRIAGNPLAVIAIVAVLGVIVMGALSIGVAHRALGTVASESHP